MSAYRQTEVVDAERPDEGVPLHLVNIVVLGDTGVGKTAICQVCLYNRIDHTASHIIEVHAQHLPQEAQLHQAQAGVLPLHAPGLLIH